MKSPKIQLFNAVFSTSLGLGYTTFDYSPGEGTPYPFVHVAEVKSADVINNKQTINGIISQTIHVWGYADNRALFVEMVFNLEQELRQLTRLKNYYLRFEGLDSNEVYDNSTKDNLLHGIIQAEYKLI
ncbi:hypothetical protein GLW20_01610 [Virgibacillus halodenitrificans]|nr:hypothetical protein [Virgibacillus halodenitrificans]